MDRKRNLFRLMETYMNDFRGDAVQEMYGKGSKIKIHSMSHGLSTDMILFELVIELGETINESVMNSEFKPFSSIVCVRILSIKANCNKKQC